VEWLTATEARLPWLRVLTNPENLGFIASCNRGAHAATGEFVVFLNDDTVPLEGWLGALLGTFMTHPDAGVVGGRLLFADGRLQEAGCYVFEDGRAANFGRGEYDVDHPLFGYVRPVDYCSGALLATRRSTFQELGGFDLRYLPAYYEDTDYCMAVRQVGLQVYYQPEATVVHTEGGTSGTDLQSGAKRHQLRNRTTFRDKWRAELARRCEPPNLYTSETWHRLARTGGQR
jgi:GT2 family glycosyltransferase